MENDFAWGVKMWYNFLRMQAVPAFLLKYDQGETWV